MNNMATFFTFINNQLAGHYLTQDELIAVVASEYLKQLEEWEWNQKVKRSQPQAQNTSQINSQIIHSQRSTQKGKLEISIVYTGSSKEASQQAREIKFELNQAYPKIIVHIEQIISCQSLIMITSYEPQLVLWHTFVDGKFVKDKFIQKISQIM
ncbi:hypothetical protein pb186bvf_015051 [Paramecium bursaria]